MKGEGFPVSAYLRAVYRNLAGSYPREQGDGGALGRVILGEVLHDVDNLSRGGRGEKTCLRLDMWERRVVIRDAGGDSVWRTCERVVKNQEGRGGDRRLRGGRAGRGCREKQGWTPLLRGWMGKWGV